MLPAYAAFLFSDQAQQVAAKHFFRPDGGVFDHIYKGNLAPS